MPKRVSTIHVQRQNEGQSLRKELDDCLICLVFDKLFLLFSPVKEKSLNALESLRKMHISRTVPQSRFLQVYKTGKKKSETGKQRKTKSIVVIFPESCQGLSLSNCFSWVQSVYMSCTSKSTTKDIIYPEKR